jgi:hypothetical protein
MRISIQAKLESARVAIIEAEVRAHHSLMDAYRWFQDQRDHQFLPQVVMQDEYCLDVIFQWHDLFLVYDTT